MKIYQMLERSASHVQLDFDKVWDGHRQIVDAHPNHFFHVHVENAMTETVE